MKKIFLHISLPKLYLIIIDIFQYFGDKSALQMRIKINNLEFTYYYFLYIKNIYIQNQKAMKVDFTSLEKKKQTFQEFQQNMNKFRQMQLANLRLNRINSQYYDEYKKKIIDSMQRTVTHKQLGKQLQIYQWRNKTQFPIVKTYFIQIVASNQSENKIKVHSQSFQTKLNKLYELPLSKILYLLKESLVGFDRLIDKFGFFLVNSQMIGINQNGKCKVWMNQNFYLNSIQNIKIDQTIFIKQLLSLFSDRSINNEQNLNFFNSAKQIKFSYQLLKFIDTFAKLHNIKIPNKFISSQQLNLRQTIGRYNISSKNKNSQKSSDKKIRPQSQRLMLSQKKRNSHLQIFSMQPIQVNKNRSEKITLMKSSKSTKANTCKEHKFNEINFGSNTSSLLFNEQQNEKLSPRKNEINKSFQPPPIHRIISNIDHIVDERLEIQNQTENIEKQQSNDYFSELFNKNGWKINCKNIFNTNQFSKNSTIIGQQPKYVQIQYQFSKLRVPQSKTHKSFANNEQQFIFQQ